ncbi:MAG: CoA-binding protein [Bacteroidales bacterium]|nr:CoA-binding protein [Bacteroidales bacterium]
MTTMQSVSEFMAQKNIAIAGVSRKKQKFGNTIYKELNKKGYTLFPVNPNMEEYDGERCYPDIASLPTDVTGIVLNTKPETTNKLIEEAENKGIKHIWLQQGSTDKTTIELIEKSDTNIISKQCVIMFADPAKGIHGFHKWINKTFGFLPK